MSDSRQRVYFKCPQKKKKKSFNSTFWYFALWNLNGSLDHNLHHDASKKLIMNESHNCAYTNVLPRRLGIVYLKNICSSIAWEILHMFLVLGSSKVRTKEENVASKSLIVVVTCHHKPLAVIYNQNLNKCTINMINQLSQSWPYQPQCIIIHSFIMLPFWEKKASSQPVQSLQG